MIVEESSKTPLPENKLVTLEMMKAWGYPDDSQTRALIVRAHDLERQGHINCIAVAKNWVRGELPKPDGSVFDYRQIRFGDITTNPAAYRH